MRYLASPKEPAAIADEILAVAEVALLLNVAENTVHTMAQKSELPCFKVRGQWRFHRQDLDTWIAAQVASAAGPEEAASKKTSPTQNRGRWCNKGETRRKYVVPKRQAADRESEPHSLTARKSVTDGRIIVVEFKARRLPQQRCRLAAALRA